MMPQKTQELARHKENIHVVIGCVEERTAAQFYLIVHFWCRLQK